MNFQKNGAYLISARLKSKRWTISTQPKFGTFRAAADVLVFWQRRRLEDSGAGRTGLEDELQAGTAVLALKKSIDAMSSPQNTCRSILAVFLQAAWRAEDRGVTKLSLRLTLALHCNELADRIAEAMVNCRACYNDSRGLLTFLLYRQKLEGL